MDDRLAPTGSERRAEAVRDVHQQLHFRGAFELLRWRWGYESKIKLKFPKASLPRGHMISHQKLKEKHETWQQKKWAENKPDLHLF